MTRIDLEKILRLYAPLVTRHVCTKLHMTPEQYAHLAASINARSPCPLLVFGSGLDSPLWNEINARGQTVFLEDQPDWQQAIESRGLNVINVGYESQINVWLDNVTPPRGFTQQLMDTVWKIVVVDAPLGVGTAYGREQSIYTAALIRKRHNALVYVHDYERPWEKACCDKYLGNPTDCLGNLAMWDSPRG